jgi:hypothetical protein
MAGIVTTYPTVARVLCGLCTAEHQEEPGVLGTVQRWDDGLVWVRRLRRAPGDRAISEAGLRKELHTALFVSDLPPELKAYCRHHGDGGVSTSDVRRARGTVSVNFTATA